MSSLPLNTIRPGAGPRLVLRLVLRPALRLALQFASFAPWLAAAAWAAPASPKLVLDATGPLQFGRFAASAGGTITVTPGSNRSRSGGVVLLASTVSAASFVASLHPTGQGQPQPSADIVIITLPADRRSALQAGKQRMLLSGFTSSRPSGGVMGSATQPFTVGATLQVAPNQPPGNYKGEFDVTIEYQ